VNIYFCDERKAHTQQKKKKRRRRNQIELVQSNFKGKNGDFVVVVFENKFLLLFPSSSSSHLLAIHT
jgi:hypothetical protein